MRPWSRRVSPLCAVLAPVGNMVILPQVVSQNDARRRVQHDLARTRGTKGHDARAAEKGAADLDTVVGAQRQSFDDLFQFDLRKGTGGGDDASGKKGKEKPALHDQATPLYARARC